MVVVLAFFVFIGCTASGGSAVRERRIHVGGGDDIVEIARQYLGVPYRFGGMSPSGFDCSGLVKYVYSRASIDVPRDARDQFRILTPISVPRPGDLVFFKISGDTISHVGIYSGNFRFIHAPRTGKTVEFADIRNPYWKQRYAGARTAF